MMKPWPESGSKTRVAHMERADFYGSETSRTLAEATEARIEFVAEGGTVRSSRRSSALQADEIIDTAVMNVAALRAFYAAEMRRQEDGVLLSLHLKATMMKVSDPVMFGHCVSVYFAADAREARRPAAKDRRQRQPRPGRRAREARPPAGGKKAEIEADIAACYERGPALAMVDSRRGITNLHVPNDVIIDASLPVVIRDGGSMWNRDDQLQDTVALVPDRSYATMYQRWSRTASSTASSTRRPWAACQRRPDGEEGRGVRLPRQDLRGARGRHDPRGGRRGRGPARRRRSSRRHLPHVPDQGRAVRDWVKLAVTRARATGSRRPSSGSTRGAPTTTR
jgi:isocitrate dehydrogenase